MTDTISSEIVLEYKKFSAGITAVNQSLGSLQQQASAAFGGLEHTSQRSLAAVISELKRLDSTFQSSIKNLSQSTKAFDLDRLSGGLDNFGNKARTAFSGAVGVGAEFEAELNKIASITNLSAAELAAFGEKLRTTGKDLGLAVGPTEAASAALEIMSSNFESTGEASLVLASSLKLIADGSANAGQATKLITGALNAYGAGADQAARFTDVLFQTVNLGATTIPELTQSLGLVTSSAAAAGVSFEELSAAIATSTIRGMSTSSSVEGLRGLLSSLINPTNESTKAQKQFGLSIDYTTVKQRGLLGTLQMIKQAVGDNSQAFAQIVGGQLAFQTALALTNDKGDKFAKNLAEMSKAAGAADRAVSKVAGGLAYTQRAFGAAMDRLQVSSSRTALPALTSITNATANVVDAIDALPAPLKSAGLAATALATSLGLAAGGFIALNAGLAAAGFQTLGYTRILGGLATAAKLASAEVRITGVAAAGAQMLKGATYANAFALSLTGLKTAARSVYGLLSSGTLVVAAAGVEIVAIASKFAAAREEAEGFADALVSQGASFKSVTAGVNTGHLTGKTGKEVLDAGISLESIDKAIQLQRNALTRESVVLPPEIRPVANGTVSAITNAIPGFSALGQIQALRNQEEEYLGTTRVQNDVLSKDDPQRAVIEARIEALKRQREEYVKAKALQDEQQKALSASQEAARRASLSTDKEALKDELQRIDLSKVGHQEKVRQLESLRSRFALDRDEQRQITREISQEEKKAAAEAERDRSRRAADEKKQHQERLAQSVQDIENSKAADAEKAKSLTSLIAKYHLSGDERRAIEDKVLAHVKNAAAERERLAEREREIHRRTLDDSIKASELRSEYLQRHQEKGIDTTAAQIREVDSRTSAQSSLVQSQLDSDLSKETDPANKTDLRAAATSEIRHLEATAQAEKTRLAEEGAAKRVGVEQAVLQSERQIAETRIQLLKEEAVAGKVSAATVAAAIASKLQLIEQEIALQAELASLQTSDPRRIAQIEIEAQGQILQARLAARNEIEETNKALDEQQKRLQGNREFSGGILSLEQFIQGEQDRFSDKKDEGMPARGTGLLNSQIKLSRNSLLSINRQAAIDDELSGKSRRGLGDDGFGNAPAARHQSVVAGKFILETPDGKVLGEAKEVTVNGRGSREERRDRTSSSRQF